MKTLRGRQNFRWVWACLASLLILAGCRAGTKEAGSSTVITERPSLSETAFRSSLPAETQSATASSASASDSAATETPPASGTQAEASSASPATSSASPGGTTTKASSPPTTQTATSASTAASSPAGTSATQPETGSGRLSAHFIDVGQGDSVLVCLPNGQTMLIDAGEAKKGSSVLEYLQSQNITHIDYLVATHPHADHIGGLPAVIKAFSIGKVYMPKAEHTTKTYENLLTAIADKGLKITAAKAGVTVLDEPGLKVTFLAPASDKYKDLNNYSAVLQIQFKDTAFLLMGDAEKESEEEIVARYGDALAADVVKAGHHGSRTSSTQKLIAATQAQYVVFCCGKDNSYGHPHEETVSAWTKAGAALFRTDVHGTITAVSDGKTVTVTTEK